MRTIPPSPRPSPHGNLPDAMRAAVREILDEGGPEDVLLREVARRVGVTSAAAYRHFRGKEGLLASVATEGFRELAAAMERAAAETDPLARAPSRLCQVRAAKAWPVPHDVRTGSRPSGRNIPSSPPPLGVVRRMVTGVEGPPEECTAAIAAWGLVHGLSALFVDEPSPRGAGRKSGGRNTWALADSGMKIAPGRSAGIPQKRRRMRRFSD